MIKFMKKVAFMFAFLILSGWQDVAAYEWNGHTLEDVLSTGIEENDRVSASNKSDVNKTVFLYNVALDKFLNVGGSWGTHASLMDVGIRCWLLKHSYTSTQEDDTSYDGYLIETACSNSRNSQKGNKLGLQGDNLFLDIENVSSKGQGYTYWNIKPISDGSNILYFQLQAPNKTGYLCVDDNNVDVNIEEALPTDPSRAQWILVTEQDLLDKFNHNAVELGGKPADATFLIGDYDFNRYSTELSRWNWTKGTGVLRVGIDCHFQTFTNSISDAAWNNKADTYGADGTNGKYWCAKINNGTGTLSQTITVNKSGWYRLSCQGEFYLKDASENKYAFLFAKAGDKEEVSQPLRITSNAIKQFSNNPNVKNNVEGKHYYNEYGDYTNTVMVYVDCGKDNSQKVELQLGVKVTGVDVPTSDIGVAVDAFRLQYCGVPADHELILDENFTNFDYINKETQKVYQNSILYLHRSFNLGCWNTIILPVNLTAEQFNTAFGADSKLARYEGVKNNHLQFTVQDDKKAYDTEEKGAFLKANIPYIIWPTAEASQKQEYSYSTTYGNESTEQHEVTVGTPYYVVNNVTLDKENVKSIIVEGDTKNGYSFNGILVRDYEGKTFIDGAHVKAGDYTFSQGKLHQFKNDYGMRGFRAWFTSYANTNPESQAKPIGVEINGVQGGEVTGLEFVAMPQGKASSSTIYDLRGQKMNAKSIDELPHGIYIINHKKYVVK